MKLIEGGTLQAMRNHYKFHEVENSIEAYSDVKLREVYVIFAILPLGLIVSLTIFTIEHITARRSLYFQSEKKLQVSMHPTNLKMPMSDGHRRRTKKFGLKTRNAFQSVPFNRKLMKKMPIYQLLKIKSIDWNHADL